MKTLSYLAQIKIHWNNLKSIFKWHELDIVSRVEYKDISVNSELWKCTFLKSKRISWKEKLLKVISFIVHISHTMWSLAGTLSSQQEKETGI